MTTEGTFEGTPRSRDEYQPTRCDTADVKRTQDNMGLEGESEVSPRNTDDIKPTRGDFADVKILADNLQEEGHFEGNAEIQRRLSAQKR
jgi:hypothetical protein